MHINVSIRNIFMTSVSQKDETTGRVTSNKNSTHQMPQESRSLERSPKCSIKTKPVEQQKAAINATNFELLRASRVYLDVRGVMEVTYRNN